MEADKDFSEKIDAILSNPKFQEMANAMKGENGALQTEEMLGKLPEMMAFLRPMMGDVSRENGGEAEKQPEKTQEAAAPEKEASETAAEREKQPEERIERRSESSKTHDSGQRTKLFAALKPYLSPARCEIIDKAMSVMQFGELLGRLPPIQKQGETGEQSTHG